MRPCRSSILNANVDRCVFQQQAFDSCCRFLSPMYVWWCWYLFPFKCVLCLLCSVDCAVVVVKNAHCVIWCIVNLNPTPTHQSHSSVWDDPATAKNRSRGTDQDTEILTEVCNSVRKRRLLFFNTIRFYPISTYHLYDTNPALTDPCWSSQRGRESECDSTIRGGRT